MVHSHLSPRFTEGNGKAKSLPLLIVGVFGFVGFLLAMTVCITHRQGIKTRDSEAQRAQQPQSSTAWHGQSGREITAERQTRQTREAREARASNMWESRAETQTRQESEDRYWESPPPMYRSSAGALASIDSRRQRAPLGRPLPDLPTTDSSTPPLRTQPPTPSLTPEDRRRQRAPLSRDLPSLPSINPNRPPKYEAPPAYDSAAVWPSRD